MQFQKGRIKNNQLKPWNGCCRSHRKIGHLILTSPPLLPENSSQRHLFQNTLLLSHFISCVEQHPQPPGKEATSRSPTDISALLQVQHLVTMQPPAEESLWSPSSLFLLISAAGELVSSLVFFSQRLHLFSTQTFSSSPKLPCCSDASAGLRWERWSPALHNSSCLLILQHINCWTKAKQRIKAYK